MEPVPEQMMRIAVRGGAGDANSLYLETVSTPKVGPGQVLIKVHAAGVNRPDLLQRAGLYPPPPGAPDTLGLEVAGEIVAIGDKSQRWKTGDQVCALLAGGGYAEYALADTGHVLPVLEGLDMLQAACLPETVFTVFSNVFKRARLQAGETLLVHAGTSGIGVTAVLMGKAAGARVISTSRGPSKAKAALELGADLSLDTNDGEWLDAVIQAGGADVVLDMLGGAYFEKNVNLLKPDGRLALIAFLAGGKAELDLAAMLVKRLALVGFRGGEEHVI